MSTPTPTEAPAKSKVRPIKSAETQHETAREPFVASRDRLKMAEERRQSWHLTVPPGIKPADLHMRQEAFSAVADLLSLGDDLVIVTADDRTLMRGLCLYGNRGAVALVAITDLFEVPLVSDSKSAPPGYSIRRATSEEQMEHGSWLVLRNEDQQILNYGRPLLTEDEARAFLNQHPAIRALGMGTKPIMS